MFNNTYIKGGNTNIGINSVSGTLVKNYQKSFFYQCKQGTKGYEALFDPENPVYMFIIQQKAQLNLTNMDEQFITKK